MKRAIANLAAAAFVLCVSAHVGVAGETTLACEQPHDLDKYALLKRLSLDLRNRVPSIEEYQALDPLPTVPATVIDAYLADDGFRRVMRRHHENLLWPNVSNVRLVETTTNLSLDSGPGALRMLGREFSYRGIRDVTCDDVEQKSFDPAYPNDFRPIPVRVAGSERHEGWRMVHPYWDPASTVKVCAYDAQETKSVMKNGKPVACNTPEGRADKACGCGPGLSYCYAQPASATVGRILSSLREQLGRLVDRATSGKVPYTELLLADDVEENGAIAFWRKNIAPQGTTTATYNVPLPSDAITNAPFTDDGWHAVARSKLHAGVLTLPGFLLRFQTDRGRANRFRIAFQNRVFVPAAKLDPEKGCSADSPDLTARCNCQYCHATLEPLAAHFGNFAEAGSTAMNDPKLWPVERPDCVDSKDALCRRFYVTESDATRPGFRLSHQFAGAHPAYVKAIDDGPRALAEGAIADRSFATATVQNLYLRFVHREMRIDGDHTEDLATMNDLVAAFVASNYDLPALVKKIVSLPEYRRVR
jgi:hypothetical protein